MRTVGADGATRRLARSSPQCRSASRFSPGAGGLYSGCAELERGGCSRCRTAAFSIAHRARRPAAVETVQSVDRAALLLKADRRPLPSRRPPGSWPAAAASTAAPPGGCCRRWRRTGWSSATRPRSATGRLRGDPDRRRPPTTTRSPAACARSSSGWRRDRRDRDAGRRPPVQPRLRRPGRPAQAAQPQLDGPADPAARHLLGQGVPGLAARARSARSVLPRELEAIHRRRRSPTAAELEPSCREIRRDGYGGCLGEFEEFSNGVSAARARPRGRPVVIVNIWGPSQRVTAPAAARARPRGAAGRPRDLGGARVTTE